jgi:hypothetical protein
MFCTNTGPTTATLALGVLLEPAHRSQQRLQPAVIAFDVVVGVLLHAMPYAREHLIQHNGSVAALGDDLYGVTLVVPMAC